MRLSFAAAGKISQVEGWWYVSSVCLTSPRRRCGCVTVLLAHPHCHERHHADLLLRHHHLQQQHPRRNHGRQHPRPAPAARRRAWQTPARRCRQPSAPRSPPVAQETSPIEQSRADTNSVVWCVQRRHISVRTSRALHCDVDVCPSRDCGENNTGRKRQDRKRTKA